MSRSAVETVKIARETMEGLFNLHVGLAEEVVGSLCAGIADCISGYAPPHTLTVGSAHWPQLNTR